MIIVIAAMLVGVLIGFLVREKKALLKVVDVLVNAAIYMLLLLLGISVGSNQAIISNLDVSSMKILEVGAGSGRDSLGLAQHAEPMLPFWIFQKTV